MAIKTVYIHPGDLLDIRFVFDVGVKPNKANYNVQRPHQLDHSQLLIKAMGNNQIGYFMFDVQVALLGANGSIRRVLQ